MIRQKLMPEVLEGCYLQDITFRPTFHKWGGELCRGFMIHVLDCRLFHPYFTSIALLKTIIDSHGKDFRWKEPPYEYEYQKMPIDLILGDSSLRREIEKGSKVFSMEEKWGNDLNVFREWRKPFLLYT